MKQNAGNIAYPIWRMHAISESCNPVCYQNRRCHTGILIFLKTRQSFPIGLDCRTQKSFLFSPFWARSSWLNFCPFHRPIFLFRNEKVLLVYTIVMVDGTYFFFRSFNSPFGFIPSRHTAGVHPCSKAGCEADEECQVDEKGMPQCLCVGPCPPIHRPVCGSDEMTYSSTCELQRQSCLKKRNITLLYEGVCGKFTPVTHSPGVAHLYFSLFCGLFQFCFKDN